MPATTATITAIAREELIAWYRRNRARSAALFDLLSDDAYYTRPIALRHPIVFYDGHLPAFSFNTLVKRGLGRPSIDPRLESLFARGIDPHEADATKDTDRPAGWPDRSMVRAFAAEADRQVLDALAHADISRPGHPLLHDAEAAFCILEHEAMHQETLLYMWHRLPIESKRRPSGYKPITEGSTPPQAWVDVRAGDATLGIDQGRIDFAWDNERPAHRLHVDAFRVQQHSVTNAQFMDFVDAGGYDDPRWWRAADWQWRSGEGLTHPLFWERDADGTWFWRGMFDRVPLPPSWPVYVSKAEADAYVAWHGSRLMTEAEFQRAAFGEAGGAECRHPWGDASPSNEHGVFDFRSWDPLPAGSHPDGASAWGAHDLVGNGWEWTATQFAPFPGFAPMPSYPEYSAEFFDGEHFVMKGASSVTAAELLRPTFRNWFRARYPYVYAKFRCARDAR
jgi:gamma-glutamyl hercynylcysteine S-oxide synthase